MPIPNNIERAHILNVMNQINNGRQIPAMRRARTVACSENGIIYPVKLLISWGNEIPNRQEFPSKQFITTEAVVYLSNLGFNIVNI